MMDIDSQNYESNNIKDVKETKEKTNTKTVDNFLKLYPDT